MSNVKILDFYAEWCGPCQMMKPTIEKLSKEYEVEKIDIEQSNELARQYGVQSIPTIVILRDGEEIDRSIGFASEDKLRTMLK